MEGQCKIKIGSFVIVCSTKKSSHTCTAPAPNTRLRSTGSPLSQVIEEIAYWLVQNDTVELQVRGIAKLQTLTFLLKIERIQEWKECCILIKTKFVPSKARSKAYRNQFFIWSFDNLKSWLSGQRNKKYGIVVLNTSLWICCAQQLGVRGNLMCNSWRFSKFPKRNNWKFTKNSTFFLPLKNTQTLLICSFNEN